MFVFGVWQRERRRLTCPLHRCSSANLVAGPQEMLKASIDASTHTATRASRLLHRIRAVLLSVEKRRFIKKMTEHFERALAMRNRQLLAIADYTKVSDWNTSTCSRRQTYPGRIEYITPRHERDSLAQSIVVQPYKNSCILT